MRRPLKGTLFLFAAVAAAAPTYNGDVAPILHQNCASCHRPGEVAPFSLLTYQDAAKRARLIAQVTERRYMPPWSPEPGYGNFAHERRLTEAQIKTIGEWAGAGAPEGAGPAPAPPAFAGGWQSGEPDEVVKMAAPYTLPADGRDQFRCFVLQGRTDREVNIGAAEFRPGNPRIVHHAIMTLDTTGQARQRAQAGGGSYSCFGGAGTGAGRAILAWAPGAPPSEIEPGISIPVPKGADIVVQIHYHPSGKAETDQSSLGLHYTGPPTKGVAGIVILNRGIDIAPGDKDYRIHASMTVPRDAELLGIFPHAHYLGKEMKVTAHLPDGRTEPLIWIKDWDFNWQGQYRYAKPMKLPAGTRIDLDYSYDNSADNPQNPSNPPVRVRWGEQTTDEMALAGLQFVLPTPEDAREFQRAVLREYIDKFLSDVERVGDLPPEVPPQVSVALQRALRRFDENANGRIDPSERAALQRAIALLLPR